MNACGFFWLLNGSDKGRDASAHMARDGILGYYWKNCFLSAFSSSVLLYCFWSLVGFGFVVFFWLVVLFCLLSLLLPHSPSFF